MPPFLHRPLDGINDEYRRIYKMTIVIYKRPIKGRQMSEFDRDDYDKRLRHLTRRHEISAAWIVMVLIALFALLHP